MTMFRLAVLVVLVSGLLGFLGLYHGINHIQVMLGAAAVIFAMTFAFIIVVRYCKTKATTSADLVLSAVIALVFTWLFLPTPMPRYQTKALERYRIHGQK